MDPLGAPDFEPGSPAEAHLTAARLLWSHRQAGTSLEALPPALRPADRSGGHAIQAWLPQVAGQDVVGWKIAATSAAGQAHIGVGGPLAGRVIGGQVDADGAVVSLTGNRMCVAEPEFAFRIDRTIEPRAAAYSVQEVLDAVGALLPAIEVPDSRFTDFARAGEAQLIADDACAHRFVLGAPAAPGWRSIDLRTHRVTGVTLHADGRRTAREGNGTAVLDDPRVALAWLVNELSSLGVSLKAGQFVSTGTCMVPIDIRPGDRVVADFGVLGQVSAAFER